MIRVTIGNNLKRTNKNYDPNTTLKAALEDAGVDYSYGTLNLDGCSLDPGKINQTFAELGYTGEPGKDSCFLLNVAKADNAA